jgi:hypothetical protein
VVGLSRRGLRASLRDPCRVGARGVEVGSRRELEEARALLAALVLLAGKRKRNAAYAPAELSSRRGLERPFETLVAWARA